MKEKVYRLALWWAMVVREQLARARLARRARENIRRDHMRPFPNFDPRLDSSQAPISRADPARFTKRSHQMTMHAPFHGVKDAGPQRLVRTLAA